MDAVTDVLSFPSVDVSLPFDEADYQYDIDPCDGKITLGEIMLCYSRMEDQSVEYGHSKERECCYLVLHGLLHLLGFDHMEATPLKRKLVSRIVSPSTTVNSADTLFGREKCALTSSKTLFIESTSISQSVSR